MRKIVLLAALLASGVSAAAETARPWTFWYWMYGAVSREGIRADLQAMRDVGLGGCYLMPVRGTAEAPATLPQLDEPPTQQLTPRFWQLADYAMQLCDSLGLEMGIHICDGFALAGGPWITPAESMQKVVFCDTVVGGGRHHFLMRKPPHYEDYYEDIGVYAIPVSADDEAVSSERPVVSGERIERNAKGVYCADEPCWLQYSFDNPVLVRNIEIEPSGTNIQCQRLLVKASDDGVSFHHVKQLTPPRQGWQNTGFNTTFSIPPTKARHFRFEWTPEGTEPGAEDLDAAKWKPVLRLKSIRLSGSPRFDNWEGKAGYVWRIAPDTPAEDLCPLSVPCGLSGLSVPCGLPARSVSALVSPNDILTAKTRGDEIHISLPEGNWRILRMGHTSTGHTNATAGGGRGLECDKFSAAAVNKQLDGWFAAFMRLPHHRVVKYMHVDSWECGSQNWSATFAAEFERRRGYSLLPYMPVYAGVAVEGGEKVLRDIRTTINELVNDVFFATLRRRARLFGVQLSSESVAPTMVSDGLQHYKYVDLPMGEFWLNSPTHDKPTDMLDAISGAHVYGKPLVQAEGLTEVRGVWDETPADVKPLIDRNFALGMNRLFFHVFTHNPWTDKKPGMTLDGIGLFFQRDQTWFPEARPLADYVARCQQLLQQGRPVVDIAVYTGEEMPRRSLTPDRLVTMLPGLFGADRVASERHRLANHGLPMIESPVGVRHAAGILDLKDWVNPLHGYQYDSMNKEALMLCWKKEPLPYQPDYKALVIPENSLVSDEARVRIDQLRQQGIIVIDKTFTEPTLPGITPDAVLPDGIAYTHRTTEREDIYFLSNQTPAAVSFQPMFRDSCQQPVLYYPLNDQRRALLPNEQITMQPYEALFVIFSQEAQPLPMPVTTCLRQRRPDAKLKWRWDAPWQVTFQETGKTLCTDTLFDWSRHPDDAVCYYSGHARYTTSFKYKNNTPAVLALGDVRDVAHVWVNGIDCGIAWTAPYEVDITKALRKGKNKLEIEVVNTWHNALRGADAGTPPFPGIWTNAKYRSKRPGTENSRSQTGNTQAATEPGRVKGDCLIPAGLLGPVTLKAKETNP